MARLLDGLPWRALGALVLAAVLFAAGWTAQGWRKDAERDRERRDQALAQVNAVDRARLEEQRRTAAQTEIAHDTLQQAEAARADARAADAVARELRARATALTNAGRRPADTAIVGGGAPAPVAADLLADVLGRTDARAGELAEALDASRVAGLACERSYDALTP
ncbi:DUF2514 family protein [Cupriavidus necator]|uniref:DUF2514 family protein n=1 Tax=Cupriavidus necator TaxID=106590 RepID=UPI0030F3AA9A